MSVVEIKKTGAIPVDVYDTKQYKKAEKALGRERAKAIVAMTTEELNDLIVKNSLEKDSAKAKVKENREYLKAKNVTDTFNSALKATTGPLDDTIKLALTTVRLRTEE